MLPQDRSLMTSHWDAETYLWPFQLRSIRSMDLNLDCWEARIPRPKPYQHCPRANFESNDSYEPVHRPAKKYMESFWTPQFHSSWFHYIHQNAQRLPWVIRNQRLNSLSMTLSMTASPRSAFFRVTFPLAYLRWTVLIKYIFANVINSWSRISKESNYFHW